jgi:hypothetical protein
MHRRASRSKLFQMKRSFKIRNPESIAALQHPETHVWRGRRPFQKTMVCACN